MSYPNEFKLSGKIIAIDKERPASETSKLILRNFILSVSMMGNVNHLSCQTKGENNPLLNNYIPGDEVDIKFCLLGNYKGSQYKEGNPKCATNPNGVSDFSPTCNVFEINLQEGFKRRQDDIDKVRNWRAPGDNTPVINSVQNQNTGNPAGGSPETIDDLPF